MYHLIDLYEKELLVHVLPFWMQHSLDWKHGGYFTCLTQNGTCYDPRKYMWLQGRQVWMLAKLYNTYEQRLEWLEASRLGLDFIHKFGNTPEDRVYFSLTREGHPASLQRKLFSECFYIMAMAESYRATGDPAIAAEALKMFNVVEDLIAYPDKLGRPMLAGCPPMKTLAIPMIMLNLIEEMNMLLPAEIATAKSAQCIKSMLQHYDENLHLLREFIGLESNIEYLPEGRLINPGHSIEAAWFLLHHAIHNQDKGLQQKALTILEGSLEFGWDPQFRGIFYFMDSAGYPLPQLEYDMKLWWPHTEAIYALVAAWCLTGDNKYAVWLERVHEYSFEHFVDHKNGEWFGYCNRRGEVTHSSKGGPYKGCFHVPRALLFSIQALKQHKAQSTGMAAHV